MCYQLAGRRECRGSLPRSRRDGPQRRNHSVRVVKTANRLTPSPPHHRNGDDAFF
jgi:hypothetical protein